MHRQRMCNIRIPPLHLIVGAVFVVAYYVATRLYPLWKHADAAFGYDTGIYRRIIREYAARPFGEGPDFAFSAYSSMLAKVGGHVDAIAFGWYFLCAVLLCALVFFIAQRSFNTTVGVLAVALLSVSALQYEFYWWYYYRNMLSMVLCLGAWLLYNNRSWWFAAPLTAALSIHPVSAALFYVVFFADSITKKQTRHVLALVGVAVAVALLNWEEFSVYAALVRDNAGLLQNMDAFNAHILNGQFVSLSWYAAHAWWYALPGIIGILHFWKKDTMLTMLAVASLLAVAMPLMFHRRFLVQADIALILFAAYTVWHITRSARWKTMAATSVVMGVAVMALINMRFIAAKQPLVSHTELTSLVSEIRHVPQDARVMALSSQSAPWIYGYATQAVIAPGMFEENKWGYEGWIAFWNAPDADTQKQLLSTYNDKALYIIALDNDQQHVPLLESDNNARRITKHIWEYQL